MQLTAATIVAMEPVRPEKDPAALASALLLFALAFGSALVPAPFGAPKLAFFAAFVIYALALAGIPALRRSARAWARAGALDRGVALGTFGLSIASLGGLLLYERLEHPDVSNLAAQLPPLEGPALAAVGLALGLVNALTEEIAYRGVLQHALESELGPGALSLVLQGIAFAAPHYEHGYPRGPIGLVLTSVFGITLGVLMRRSRGLVAPTAAHVVADLTIFAIVARSPRG